MRRSALKALPCNCCRLRSHARSAAWIPSSLYFRPQTRQFSSAVALLNGDNNGVASPAAAAATPASAVSPKPTSPKFGFGGGWGKPTFGSGSQLTVDEMNQRERVLAQRKLETARIPPKPAENWGKQTNQARVKQSTQTTPNANRFRIIWGGSKRERDSTLATTDSPPRTDGFGRERRPPEESKPATDSGRAYNGPGSNTGFVSFMPQRGTGDSIGVHKGPASGSSERTASKSSSVAEREARFRDNGSDTWGFTRFRKILPEPSDMPTPGETGPQVPRREAPPPSKQQDVAISSPHNQDLSSSAEKRQISEVETDIPSAVQIGAAEGASRAPRQQKKKDRWKSTKELEAKEQDFFATSRRFDYDLDEEFDVEDDDGAGRARRRRKERKKEKEAQRRAQKDNNTPTPIYLPEFISVANLANALSVRPSTFLESLQELGFEEATFDHVLDAETAGLIAAEYNYEPIFETNDNDLVAQPIPEDTSHWPSRPPVVTIMGHVDHGKTTILDWLRKSSVAASEHGGITQHIGAFSVMMPSGKQITFLDTPGHAAFLEMRKRGADVTDIVILVVAADDSVKPQTIEAIKHAKQANVPMIVAINKVDKDNVNIERVKQDLARHNVSVEDYGGDVQAVCVSGKTGQGMLELEEAAVTLSEMLDLRADHENNVEGWVIEATTKPGGRVATVLVRRGTLRPGDVIVAGTAWARIRTLKNEAGVEVKDAPPGTPVEVDGWREQPLAGNEVLQATSEQIAKDVVQLRLEKEENKQLSGDMEAINEARRERRQRAAGASQEESNDELAEGSDDSATSGSKGIPFIIKSDVSGSAEAIVNSVSAIGNNEVYANVLRSTVGQVSEFDIEHAAAANAHIISFNQIVDPQQSRLAESKGVKILDHRVIYELIDDVKAKLSEHLPPNLVQRVSGEAEIGQIFEITLKGRLKTSIAGCKVKNGVITRAHKVRVFRGKNKDVVYDGTISSLKNVKKDVTEMRKGTECGMAFENWTEFQVGDQVQTYDEIREKRHL
ncbi:hypothetical protein D8B26_003432 [Coccidioides posadasii str. Silveira]|uniref:Translation initiation factor IF-2, mitochondrial n=1 Tax=Coccidioides posadasii (strain RMSCC 757 / Silveira) TaxID=443226 RepID=E9CZL5_COCPS|nr:mitochondrial translation initiation factor [Coccidioides posadasii str. Silveira]QVM08756.1 hypothetical protein D8B26_003432 [Coccidioides posadasii str. Silveira]